MRMFLAAAALALVPTAVSAATYDFARDFGSSVFRYGYGQGASFTAFTSSTASGCFGVANLACRNSGGDSLPYIGATTDGSGFAVSTVNVPANTLLFHPGQGVGATDAILIFVAPRSTTYTLSGTFSRVDTVNGGGNGVALSAYVNGNLNDTSVLSSAAYGASLGINGTVALNAGDTIQLNVGNNGEFSYDTTGLQGSITAAGVPEPASWALMIGGFGLAGGSLRRRKVRVAFA